MSPALQVSGLKAYYRTAAFGVQREVRAVDDISLSIALGEIYGLAGESSSGKTTLIKTIAAATQPPLEVMAGTITFAFPGGAIEMQRALITLNEEHVGSGLPALEMGIGINTGDVIVGNIGSEKRTKYGAVGAAINLAYRIESQTVGGQVLLGPRANWLNRLVIRALDRLPGQPLEWVVTCRRA